MKKFSYLRKNKIQVPNTEENRIEYVKKEKSKIEESKKTSFRFKKWTEIGRAHV